MDSSIIKVRIVYNLFKEYDIRTSLIALSGIVCHTNENADPDQILCSVASDRTINMHMGFFF